MASTCAPAKTRSAAVIETRQLRRHFHLVLRQPGYNPFTPTNYSNLTNFTNVSFRPRPGGLQLAIKVGFAEQTIICVIPSAPQTEQSVAFGLRNQLYGVLGALLWRECGAS